jgi:hypothetical protein
VLGEEEPPTDLHPLLVPGASVPGQIEEGRYNEAEEGTIYEEGNFDNVRPEPVLDSQYFFPQNNRSVL